MKRPQAVPQPRTVERVQKFASVALVLAVAADARADELGPPAPLTLPELVAAQRGTASFSVVKSLDAFGLAGDVAGTYAIGDLELVGAISVIAFAGVCIEGCHVGDSSELALGNVRAGARYILQLGSIAVAPALWGWLPTTTADEEWWPRVRAVMTSAKDSRAFLDEPALGTAVDLAWRGRMAFAQAQVGAALVADGGAQLDDVFATLGAGTRLLPDDKVALLAEWRVDAFPREPFIHTFGFGVSHGDPRDRTLRFRAHLTRGGMDLGSATVGFDLVQRW